jgi:hypothetical protein
MNRTTSISIELIYVVLGILTRSVTDTEVRGTKLTFRAWLATTEPWKTLVIVGAWPAVMYHHWKRGRL